VGGAVTPDTDAFLAEARGWLAAHVPPGPLPSVDTAEGFEWHREWERALEAARLAPAWGSQAWHRQRVLAALATPPVAEREAPRWA
jgi:hypothetical protein